MTTTEGTPVSDDKIKHEFAAEVQNTDEAFDLRMLQHGTDAYLHIHIPKSLTEEQMEGYEAMVMELHETIAMMLTLLAGEADALEGGTDPDSIKVRVEMAGDE
jgi:hypothetical protein